MSVRRSGKRRRLVVNQEVAGQHDRESKTPSRRRSSEASKQDSSDTASEMQRVYTGSANRRHQKKTTDLIPKRFLSIALVILALAGCVGCLNLLSRASAWWPEVVGDAGIRATALTGSGTLAGWFKSFLLIITGLASLQIYALRQHRCDDYRGTYKMWLWMSALFLVASINCFVDLGSILSHVTASLTGSTAMSGIWTVAAVKLVALSALVVRGLIEVRKSRSALALVVLVWLAWSAAALLQVPVVRDNLVIDYQATHGNLLLFGTATLFLAVTLYGRFVYLHAQGLIVLPAKQPVAFESQDTVDEAEQKKPANRSKRKAAALKKTADAESPEIESVTEVATEKTAEASQVETSQVETKSKRSRKKKKERPPVPKPSRPVPEIGERNRIPMKSREQLKSDADTDSGANDADSPILPLATGKRKLTRSERKRMAKLAKKRKAA